LIFLLSPPILSFALPTDCRNAYLHSIIKVDNMALILKEIALILTSFEVGFMTVARSQNLLQLEQM
jgi:hypothetical protein